MTKFFNRKKDTPGEAAVRKRIKESLNNSRIKSKTLWKYDGGKLYKTSKVFYWLGCFYTAFILLANVILLLLAIDAKAQTGKIAELTFFKSNAIVIGGMIVLLALSMIFMKLKKRMVSMYCSFGFTILMAVQIIEIFLGYYTNKGTIVGFYSPCLLVFLGALVMFIIVKNDKRKEEKLFQKEIKKIYAYYTNEEKILISEGEWDELIFRFEEERVKYLESKKHKSKLSDNEKED